MGAMKNRPRWYGRYLIMSPMKNRTATHDTEMTNSYMSPHGTRCTARPRVITPVMCRARPAVVRMSAIRTRRPGAAGLPGRLPPGSAGLAGPVVPGPVVPGPVVPGPVPLWAPSAAPVPAATPAGTRSGASAWAAGHHGAAPPEGEVGRERDHRQRVQHDGDNQEVITEMGQALVVGHQSDFPSVVVVRDGIGVRAGSVRGLPALAAWRAAVSPVNSSSKPPAGSDRARPPTSTTVWPSGPG